LSAVAYFTDIGFRCAVSIDDDRPWSPAIELGFPDGQQRRFASTIDLWNWWSRVAASRLAEEEWVAELAGIYETASAAEREGLWSRVLTASGKQQNPDDVGLGRRAGQWHWPALSPDWKRELASKVRVHGWTPDPWLAVTRRFASIDANALGARLMPAGSKADTGAVKSRL
jgi:hypothetical protein